MRPLLIIIATIAAITACQGPSSKDQIPTPKDQEPKTKDQRPTTSIPYPSASAGCLVNDEWWIIGDDAPEMLVIHPKRPDKTKFVPLPFYGKLHKGELHAQRQKKKTKHDIEAISSYIDPQGGMHVLAFGSGSKSPQRDSGLYFMNQQMSVVDWGPLYKQLRKASKISEDDWNIEGACHDANGNLYLFNRKPSAMIILSAKDWFRYLEIKSVPEIENIQVRTFELPAIKGKKSGFSGADFDATNKRIIFCSTVEISDDSYRDGEILGSFVGVIEWPSLEKIKIIQTIDGLKLESVAINAKNSQEIWGLIDNDKGGSQLLTLKID